MKQSMRVGAYGAVFIAFILAVIIFNHTAAGGIKLDLAFASVLLTIIIFVSGIIMEYLAVLIFFTIITICQVAPPAVTFSGFASEGFWLIFAGVVLGASIKQSGLGTRISSLLMRFCKGSYLSVVTCMVMFGVVMAFIMPSAMGRVMLMIPVLLEFTAKSGFDNSAKSRAGIILAGIFGTYIAGFAILPANLPNIILMGSMGSLYHAAPIYSQYFLLHFPVLGIIKLALLIAVIVKFFSEDTNKNFFIQHKPAVTKLAAKEIRFIYYLSALLLVWMTDSIHHISPAWAALAVAVLCLLPILTA